MPAKRTAVGRKPKKVQRAATFIADAVIEHTRRCAKLEIDFELALVELQLEHEKLMYELPEDVVDMNWLDYLREKCGNQAAMDGDAVDENHKGAVEEEHNEEDEGGHEEGGDEGHKAADAEARVSVLTNQNRPRSNEMPANAPAVGRKTKKTQRAATFIADAKIEHKRRCAKLKNDFAQALVDLKLEHAKVLHNLPEDEADMNWFDYLREHGGKRPTNNDEEEEVVDKMGRVSLLTNMTAVSIPDSPEIH